MTRGLENGFKKWSLLKKHRFENRFCCGQMKTEVFENGAEKTVMYTCSHQRFQEFQRGETGQEVCVFK